MPVEIKNLAYFIKRQLKISYDMNCSDGTGFIAIKGIPDSELMNFNAELESKWGQFNQGKMSFKEE